MAIAQGGIVGLLGRRLPLPGTDPGTGRYLAHGPGTADHHDRDHGEWRIGVSTDLDGRRATSTLSASPCGATRSSWSRGATSASRTSAPPASTSMASGTGFRERDVLRLGRTACGCHRRRRVLRVPCGWAHTHGFNLNQDFSDGRCRATTNIRFLYCRAVGCGYGTVGNPGVVAGNQSRSEWITGFDLQGWQDLINCEVVNCVASDNWESGFHLEPGYRYDDGGGDIGPRSVSRDIQFRDCSARATASGTRTPGHYFMSGYYLSRNTHLENCMSTNNRNAGSTSRAGLTTPYRVHRYRQHLRLEGLQSQRGHHAHELISRSNPRWALWLLSSGAPSELRISNRWMSAATGDTKTSSDGTRRSRNYRQPVNDSSFEITAIGNAMPIINREGIGNTYLLSGEGNTTIAPTPPPTANQTPWPTEPFLTPPTTAWNTTIQNITADFAPNCTAYGTGEPIQFTDLSTGPLTITNWFWQFGNSDTSTLRNPCIPTTRPGPIRSLSQPRTSRQARAIPWPKELRPRWDRRVPPRSISI